MSIKPAMTEKLNVNEFDGHVIAAEFIAPTRITISRDFTARGKLHLEGLRWWARPLWALISRFGWLPPRGAE